MLIQINISNYALIDELDLRFRKGFSVITGETGAGKSIILGALALVLGNRADINSLKEKSRKCIIEAQFDISGHDLKSYFSSNDIDYDEICILRREMTPSGKSRSFINDTPVKLNILKGLGDKLVDIHSQNRTITINDADVQMAIVDQMAENSALLENYSKEFDKFKTLEIRIDEMRSLEKDASRDHDYYQFLFDELETAGPVEGEEIESEQELRLLNNSEEIKSSLFKARLGLTEGEQNVVGILHTLLDDLQKHREIHPEIGELAKRIASILIEIKDIDDDLSVIDSKLEYDPEKIRSISDRLDLINILLHKHQVENSLELINTKNEIEEKLLRFTSLESKIADAEKDRDIILQKLEELSVVLHKKRLKAAPVLANEILSVLVQLGMKEAGFKVEVTDAGKLSGEGRSVVQFLFNANRGGVLQPMHRVASGGEMSRLMLAVKSMVSRKNSIPTIIFDELDNGVSGDIAVRVGNIMQKMANERQLLVISHLPQIAARGEWHFLVYKEFDRKFTRSLIKPLTEAERIEEVAKMLSGDNISEAARKTATELLERK